MGFGVILNQNKVSTGGTTYTNEQILNPSDATLIGLTGNPVPADMFHTLATVGDLHVWRRTKEISETIPAGYNLGESREESLYGASINYYYADSVFVYDSGKATLVSPTEQTISAQPSYIPILEDFRGKFFSNQLNQDTIYYMDPSCVITYTGGVNFKFSALQKVIGYPAVPPDTYIDYPVSVNPNAYQTGSDAQPAGYTLQAEQAVSRFDAYSGNFYVMDTLKVDEDGNFIADGDVVGYAAMSSRAKGKYIYSQPSAPLVYYVPSDATITPTVFGSHCYISISKAQRAIGYPAIPAGTTIEYLGKLGDKARMQIVSYVGTGTYGASNPCSITADFPFSEAYYLGSKSSSSWSESFTGSRSVISELLTTSYTQGIGPSAAANPLSAYAKKSSDGKTLSWYTGSGSSANQLNASGYEYYFLMKQI